MKPNQQIVSIDPPNKLWALSWLTKQTNSTGTKPNEVKPNQTKLNQMELTKQIDQFTKTKQNQMNQTKQTKSKLLLQYLNLLKHKQD
jgi:hypothetical protein